MDKEIQDLLTKLRSERQKQLAARGVVYEDNNPNETLRERIARGNRFEAEIKRKALWRDSNCKYRT